MTLSELVAVYDADDPITACQMFQDTGKEHHGQCIAMEVCREFLITGLTLEGWTAMEDEWPWALIVMAGWERARTNTSAPHAGIVISDALTAANYAGNYFEHGYDEIVASAQPSVVFTRTGGIQ